MQKIFSSSATRVSLSQWIPRGAIPLNTNTEVEEKHVLQDMPRNQQRVIKQATGKPAAFESGKSTSEVAAETKALPPKPSPKASRAEKQYDTLAAPPASSRPLPPPTVIWSGSAPTTAPVTVVVDGPRPPLGKPPPPTNPFGADEAAGQQGVVKPAPPRGPNPFAAEEPPALPASGNPFASLPALKPVPPPIDVSKLTNPFVDVSSPSPRVDSMIVREGGHHIETGTGSSSSSSSSDSESDKEDEKKVCQCLLQVLYVGFYVNIFM